MTAIFGPFLLPPPLSYSVHSVHSDRIFEAFFTPIPYLLRSYLMNGPLTRIMVCKGFFKGISVETTSATGYFCMIVSAW